MTSLKAKPAKKPDKREYTFMIVPHQGQTVFSYRIPIKAIKYAAGIAAAVVLLTGGLFINYRHTVNTASAEKSELDQLRQINSFQVKQIEELAKTTTSLQEDMTRLNKLDAEIRRMLNTEENNAASRSGINRPQVHNGQGGPGIKPSIEDVSKAVQDLQASVGSREESLKNLRDSLAARNARVAATPSIWPTNGEVTSRFGWRNSPFGYGGDYHPGIDIANDYGTPIQATADGQVVFSGWYSGYGKLVKIDHGNGIETLYGHNAELVVTVGQNVKKGDLLAYMGSTGLSTGTHCHYEVRVNGTAVNPANFL